jgi:hypothetical protein
MSTLTVKPAATPRTPHPRDHTTANTAKRPKSARHQVGLLVLGGQRADA